MLFLYIVAKMFYDFWWFLIGYLADKILLLRASLYCTCSGDHIIMRDGVDKCFC